MIATTETAILASLAAQLASGTTNRQGFNHER